MGQTGSTMVQIPATLVGVSPQVAQFLQINQTPNSLIVVPPGTTISYAADGSSVSFSKVFPNGASAYTNLADPYVKFPIVLNPTPISNQINVFPPQNQLLTTQRRTALILGNNNKYE
jgi:hypothetical protein